TGLQFEIRAPSASDIRNYPRSLYLGDYIVQPSSVMLRKSLWSRVGGFDPDYRYVEDREMWLRCARSGALFAYSGRNTCRYRKHSAALTTHAGPMALASARVLQQHLDWEVIDAARRRLITAEAWTSAGRLVLRATPVQARDCFSRAWRVRRSLRIGAYWLAASLFALKTVRTSTA
ncbi:MAG: glycosyltransferase family 2 protein, partial [Opitutaceae bacterium]|nr:glycosyltransferase family 2 protein [Opitutaceae bacterium]